MPLVSNAKNINVNLNFYVNVNLNMNLNVNMLMQRIWSKTKSSATWWHIEFYLKK